MGAFHFERADLAKSYADALAGRSPFGYASGLFLAAPRRTGKSTFLRRDLVPQLKADGFTVLYVDLWSDRDADPAELILRAVAAGAAQGPNRMRKAWDALGIRAISVGGVTIATGDDPPDAPRAAPAATLTDASTQLHKAGGGAPVALIVDEAQHGLSSEAGIAAMFALKAARDAMNQDTDETPLPLSLIFTGSHRDKLSALVLERDQPFFGASVTEFPTLGADYAQAYVDWINPQLAADNQFDPADAAAAFDLLGARPEPFRDLLRDVALSGFGAQSLGDTLATKAETIRDRLWEQYDSDFGQLTAMQRSVMHLVAEKGAGFAPFTKETLKLVGERIGKPVSASAMQSALDGLRDKGLIWRSGRGLYAVEDQGLVAWITARDGGSAAAG